MQVILGGRLRSLGSTPRPGPTGKNRFLHRALPFLPASSLFAPRVPRLLCSSFSSSPFRSPRSSLLALSFPLFALLFNSFLSLSFFSLFLFFFLLSSLTLCVSPVCSPRLARESGRGVGESLRDFMIRRDQIHLSLTKLYARGFAALCYYSQFYTS